MDIARRYDLHTIITELEAVLQIDATDFEEHDVDIILLNVKKRIDKNYHIDLSTYKVDSDELAMSQYRNAVSVFIDNVTRIHGKVCGYGEIARYLTTLQIKVSNINYLGFTKEDLKAALIAMQRKVTQPMTEEVIKAIKEKLSTVNFCWEKRLFLVLVISYDLGFKELTAAIAEILYVGVVR